MLSNEVLKTELPEELLKSLKDLQVHRKHYMKNSIISQAVATCKLEDKLRNKVNDILLLNKVKNSTSLPIHSKNEKLQIVNLPDPPVLSYTEKEDLKKAVDKRLVEMNDEVYKALENVYNNPIESENHETVLLHCHEKLVGAQREYVENLLTLAETLEEIVRIRTEEVPKTCELKIDELINKNKMLELRKRILDDCTQIKIFTATSKALDAYQMILDDVLAEQMKTSGEIEELKTLKEKYKANRTAKYEEVLKKFVDYKKEVEKNQYVCDMLRKK